MIAAFTGHRPHKLPFDMIPVITESTRQILVDLKVERAISGMALGYDLIGLKCARSVGIPVTAAIPWIGHALSTGWQDPRIPEGEYIRTLEMCDRHHVVCEGDDYRPWFLQKRNEWMVDNSDGLIACWDGTPGGTRNCIMYARKVGKPIWYFNWNNGDWVREHLPIEV